MGLFSKKKKTETILDAFSPANSDSPKTILQFGELTTDNTQFWIIYRNVDNQSVLGSGPFSYDDAVTIAKGRGLPYLLIRTNTEDDYSLNMIITAFTYKFGGT